MERNRGGGTNRCCFLPDRKNGRPEREKGKVCKVEGRINESCLPSYSGEMGKREEESLGLLRPSPEKNHAKSWDRELVWSD